MSDVDISQFSPATGRQGQATSGAYGEGAELDRLKQQLPATPPQQGQEGQPQLPPVRQLAPHEPKALPDNIAAPSDRPDEPLGGPPPEPPAAVAEAPDERLIQLADWMSRAPRTTDTTRRLAAIWLQGLAR